MAIVKIVDVVPNNEGFTLTFEFDYTTLIGSQPERYAATVNKGQWLFWKESNPTATFNDYLISLVKPTYDARLAQKNLALSLELVNKELTW